MKQLNIFFRSDFVGLIVIGAVAVVICARLFFPEPSVLVTPDFGRSDAWHFSLPTKRLLWQSLQQNQIPLWSRQMGTGFPIHAEGQTGSLFIVNVILYKTFDFVTAYNLSILLVLISLGAGTYFFSRQFIGTFGALTAALVVETASFVVAQFPHITLLQSFSLFPWVLLFVHKLAHKPNLHRALLVSLILTQQLYAGFPQAVVISVLTALLYISWRSYKKKLLKAVVWFIGSLLATLVLSAVIIIPSQEFLHSSTVAQGFSTNAANYFSFHPKNFLEFIWPFAMGNPKYGTYPVFDKFAGSVFWETIGFVGWLPLILFGLTVFYWKHLGKKNTGELTFWIVLLVIAIGMMLGRHSPLYLVNGLWPLSLFRVPARFLWIVIFALSIVSGFTVSYLSGRFPKTKTLLFIAVMCNTIFVLLVWWDYHLIVPARIWLTEPEVVHTTASGRITTIGSETLYSEEFLRFGWQNPEKYIFYRNLLAPNSEVFWKLTNTQVYAGRFLRRQAALDSILVKNLSLDKREAKFATASSNLVSLLATDWIISTVPITPPPSIPQQIKSETETLFVYPNKLRRPRIYLSRQIQKITTLEDFELALTKPLQNPLVLVENDMTFPVDYIDSKEQVVIESETDTSMNVRVTNLTESALLIVADTFYPGWKAWVDEKETEITAVNINQRGIILPKSASQVRLEYQPQSIKHGMQLTVFGYFCVILVFVRSYLVKRKQFKLWSS